MIERKKTIYITLTLAIVVLILIGKSIFLGEATDNSSISKTNMNKVSVRVIKAQMDTVESSASFKASLEASEEGIVSSKVSGKVVQVSFENGQFVSAGQILAKLNDSDIRNNIKASEAKLEAAKAQLKAAENGYSSAQIGLNKPQNNLEAAQRNYDRMKVLFEQGAISKVEFEDVESALKSAKTDLESAKANVDSSRLSIETQRANIQVAQTDLSNLRNSLQDTTITAPISGVLDGKNINIGQYISTGTVLGQVKNISPINAVVEVKESDLNYVKLGAKAKFKLNDDDQTEYEGVVKSIDGAADSMSRTFKSRIQIDNKDGKLKPGVFGNIKIVIDENKKAITLPLKVIAGSEGNYYVFINNNGVAKKQHITIGGIIEDAVEIKSGVKNRDRIICTNVSTLQDGDTVKVVTE